MGVPLLTSQSTAGLPTSSNIGADRTAIAQPMARPTVGRWERRTTIFLLLIFSDGLTGFTPIQGLLAALSYLLVFFLAARQWKRILYAFSQDLPLMALTGFTLMSFFWSVSPAYTFDTGRGLLRITVFGAYLACRYSLKELIQLVAWALGIAAVLSAMSGLGVLPGAKSPFGMGFFQGTFSHKNILARNLVVGALSFASLSFRQTRHQLFNNQAIQWMGFILLVVLVIRSEGKTALVLLTLALCLGPLRKTFRQPIMVRVPLVITQLLLAGFTTFWVAENLERIVVEGLGKKLTLTGRTELWAAIGQKVAEQPWFGYGYQAFWFSNEREDLYRMLPYEWFPTHAHSGFWDLILMLGIVGFILLVLHFFLTYLKAMALAALGEKEAFWAFQLLTVMFLSNYTITMSFLSPVDINWVLYTAIAFSLAMQARHRKRLHRQAQM
jgi:exopolysaccharide production protein ExoQ